MLSARSLAGASAHGGVAWILRTQNRFFSRFYSLDICLLSPETRACVNSTMRIGDHIERRPFVMSGIARCSAHSLTATTRSSIKVDHVPGALHRRQRRCLSDDASGFEEQFAVTGSILDARRAGQGSPMPGQFLALSHAFGPEAVAAFATHAGDNNPIHLDDEYARSAGPRTYEGRIVHGLMVAGLFSTAFGRAISGALYVSQSLRFERPVLVGQRVNARVEVKQSRVTSSGREVLLRCSTMASLTDGTVAVSGEAKVLLPQDWEVRL